MEQQDATPLAALAGASPEAPGWFLRALDQAPERQWLEVDGARIETLAWGERGRPGLLLLHGAGAHADWYSFIAPFFLPARRVVAMSWSGMGGSDWRESYAREGFVREAMAVAQVGGLFENGARPVVVGHSFGGRMTLSIAALHGDAFAAAVIVDPPVFTPERLAAHQPRQRELRPHQVNASLEEALSRFRFAPPQPCEHLFIADYIARKSLKPAKRADGGEGWVWRFDPVMWRDLRIEDSTALLRAAQCPVALLRGGKSRLMRPEDAAWMMSLLPETSPFVEIPEAGHHVMVDQPLAFVAALKTLLASWPPTR